MFSLTFKDESSQRKEKKNLAREKKLSTFNPLGELDVVDICGKEAKAFDAPVVLFSTLILRAKPLFSRLADLEFSCVRCYLDSSKIPKN